MVYIRPYRQRNDLEAKKLRLLLALRSGLEGSLFYQFLYYSFFKFGPTVIGTVLVIIVYVAILKYIFSQFPFWGGFFSRRTSDYTASG